jgi:putative spermidine/putrescine transport system substrate-binding protein
MKKLLGSMSLACAIVLTGSPQLMAQDLHIMNSGGEFGDALDKCVNEPLLKSTGIKVITETPGGFAKIAAQAKSGVITNVTSDGATGDMYRMAAEGLIEPIDWAKVNPDPMFDEAKNTYGFGQSYYSTLMAWRSDAKAPANFVDFFDTQKFPGKRVLPDYPEYVLAFAAMGDGMSPAEVEKGIDLDRAFKTLERVRKDTIWWQSGAQPAQLLKDNEAQYAIAWSGRVAGQEGISYSFNQGMLELSWFVAAKGMSDEQRDMFYKWLHQLTVAENQFCLVKAIPYPGPSPKLEAMVDPALAKTFPTYAENKKVQWLVNGQWWFDHAAEIKNRWDEFKLTQ